MNRSAVKERLREEMLERRREMAFEEFYRASARVQEVFLGSGLFRSARRLSLYSSYRNEVLTDEIFRAAINGGREVYYPRVVKGASRHIEFFRVARLDELSPGSYEIPEPGRAEERGDPASFDLVVVPGVAFDRKGARLGYGKGYYDRALAGLGCPVVALAFGFQVLEGGIPVEEHDVRVAAIVTEDGVIRI